MWKITKSTDENFFYSELWWSPKCFPLSHLGKNLCFPVPNHERGFQSSGGFDFRPRSFEFEFRLDISKMSITDYRVGKFRLGSTPIQWIFHMTYLNPSCHKYCILHVWMCHVSCATHWNDSRLAYHTFAWVMCRCWRNEQTKGFQLRGIAPSSAFAASCTFTTWPLRPRWSLRCVCMYECVYMTYVWLRACRSAWTTRASTCEHKKWVYFISSSTYLFTYLSIRICNFCFCKYSGAGNVICIYVYTYICICMYVCIHIHKYMYIHTNNYMCVYMYIYMYIYVYICIYIHVYIYTNTYIHIHIHIHI